MSQNLPFEFEPRPGAHGEFAQTPLKTLIWRVLQSDQTVRREERTERIERQRRWVTTSTEMAREVFTMSALAAAQDPDDPVWSRVRAGLRAIELNLQRSGVATSSPVGESYAGDHLDHFENVSQLQDPSIGFPKIAQIVEPAVFCDGRLAAMGKAVIAIPTEGSESAG